MSFIPYVLFKNWSANEMIMNMSWESNFSCIFWYHICWISFHAWLHREHFGEICQNPLAPNEVSEWMNEVGEHYTDGNFWRREHHGMFLSRGLKWYWGKIISPETKSRDFYSSRNIISNTKILGTFRDVPDNKVAICYIVWLPIALPGFGIARRSLQNSVFFSAGISFKLCAVQCVSIVLCAAQCNAYPLYCACNKKPVRG